MLSIDTNVIIGLLALGVLGLVAMLALSLMWRKNSALDTKKYRAVWEKIEQAVDRSNPLTYQMAVLSADKLLDKALRDSGVSGETMGERLKSAKNRFSKINDVWFAHKVRNRIAHEPEMKLNYPTTKRVLAIFKKALKELGAL